MNLSFWERDSYFSNIDVVVIGSGIVGINAALHLRKKNKYLKIIILERGILPMGASSKNAGFACFGSASELIDDLKIQSENEVFKLVEKRWKGLEKLRKNIGDKALDYHNWGGYELFDSEEKFEACNDKLSYLNKHIASIVGNKSVYKIADKHIQKFGFKNANHLLLNTAESQIDTGKMMKALIKKSIENNIDIINGIEVKAIEDNGETVELKMADSTYIQTKKVIIATNGFAKQFLPEYDLHPARAQVLITEPIKNLKLKGAFHYDSGYYYFRNINNRILLGGGRNIDFKGETTTDFGTTLPIQNKLEKLLYTTIIPYAKPTIDMRWSGIMGIGNQKQSIVKKVSTNIFCGVRMGGMGVAIGSLIGEEVAEQTLE